MNTSASRNDDRIVPELKLMELVKETRSHPNFRKQPLKLSLSEPSSPNKLYRPRKTVYNDDDSSSATTGSSTTITSEDGGLTGSRDLPGHTYDDHPDIIVSSNTKTDETDSPVEFRKRAGTGSKFYHESFGSANVGPYRPSLYIPANHTSQQFIFNGKAKKQKGILNRLRHSFNKHKPVVIDKTHNKFSKQKKWIDHEDELDPVSRPSYFRHIGHVIKAGPGLVQTIQLNRPPQGRFGIYIAQGIDVESNTTSIFVSRFYQANMSLFYGSLLQPGDEIIAINGRLVRDVPILTVTKLLAGLDTVQLTILPKNVVHTSTNNT